MRQILRSSGRGLWGRLALGWLLATMAFAAPGQEADLFLEDAKAHYLIEVVRHTQWPDDETLGRIQVAVLTSDGPLKKAIQAREPVSIRGKSLTFSYLEEADLDPAEYDLIFLGRRFKGLNDSLMERTTSTLIVVDGRVGRDHQMVDFITLGGQLTIRINRDNLVGRGFQPSIGLLEFAGTREDLTDELRESQSRLDALVDEVETKEARVEALNAELVASAESLDAARAALLVQEKELAESQRQLGDLVEQIGRAQREVQGYRVEIEAQQAQFANTQEEIRAKQVEIQAKEEEIRSKQQAIDKLESEIGKNQQVLDRQLAEIEQQRSMLLEKTETIDSLRNRMAVAIGVVVVFFVLVYFLLRLNNLRKRANQELATLNAQLYELATTDSLTGLSNRRHFIELAQKQLLKHQRNKSGLVVLMIDIDHFKKVNDNHGHAAGDEVIRAVGQLLSDSLREYDLVGRLGGEEYAMLLVDCDEEQSLDIANRVCTGIAATEIVYQEQRIKITISIGIGRMMPGDRDIEQPLARADTALFQAKERGRNRVVVYQQA